MNGKLPDETPFDGVPYVGCAVTEPCGSDSYPGTVVWVSEQKVVAANEGRGNYPVIVPLRIRVKPDRYRVVNGSMQDGSAMFEYYDGGPESNTREYSWRSLLNGYVQVGTPSRSSAAQRLGFGYRQRYYDPSF